MRTPPNRAALQAPLQDLGPGHCELSVDYGESFTQAIGARYRNVVCELLADRDRLTAERDSARFAAENYRERYMSANDDPGCPALMWKREAK